MQRAGSNWGNLLSKTVVGSLTGETMNFTVNTSNQFIPPAGSKMVYGTAGATSVDQVGNNYTYNAEGQLTQMNNGSYVTSYTYDGNGQRVVKQSTMASKLYWYGPDGRILNESDTSGNITDRYGWFNGEMVGRLDSSGPLHFIYHDHLGSTRLVVSSTGQVQDDLDYYPFGTAIPKQWTSNNMYQFTGYETDTESGTEHAWFRNYSLGLGRYMRPDPYMGSYDLFDPQSLNRYSYVGNRPIIYLDQLGLECQWDDGTSDDDPEDGGADAESCVQQGGTYSDGGGGYWSENDNGTVNCSGNCNTNQQVNVTATPDSGGTFNMDVGMLEVSAMFQQSGFFVSLGDMKLPIHKADQQLRSSDPYCSAHVLLNSNADGSTSISIHTDLVNPFMPTPYAVFLHGALDVTPDVIQMALPGMPTGSDGCGQ